MGLHILKTWPAMANFLETKSEFPLIAWHKITGERVAGPERPAFGDPTGERLGDDGEPGLKKIFRASRARFTGALLSQVLALGIEVSFGQRVTEYLEDQDGAAVVVEDGTRFEADVVIAADGVGTKSHKLVNGHEVRAMSSKHSIFRTSFPIELVEADPELAARFPLTDEGIAVFELWTGTGLSLSIYRGLTELQFTISHKVSLLGILVKEENNCALCSRVDARRGSFTSREIWAFEANNKQGYRWDIQGIMGKLCHQ